MPKPRRSSLMTPRQLLLLFVSVVVGAAGGLLLYAADHASVGRCIILGAAAFLTTLKALDELVDRTE